jgi:uncharacterized small protein (DUF1192 family)
MCDNGTRLEIENPIYVAAMVQAEIDRLRAEIKKLKAEIERLQAKFTGSLLQSPLEMIRAKCEQYWNESGPLCDEEWHAILGFIHQLAVSAEMGIPGVSRPGDPK